MINDYTKRGFNNEEYLTYNKDIVSILQAVYPVGSIYMSINSANPSVLFGFGTWEQYSKGQVLVGVDDNDPDFKPVDGEMKSGGHKTVTLTAAQSGLRAHKHDNTIEVKNSVENALNHEHSISNANLKHRHSISGSDWQHTHTLTMTQHQHSTTIAANDISSMLSISLNDNGSHNHSISDSIHSNYHMGTIPGINSYGMTNAELLAGGENYKAWVVNLEGLTDSYRFVTFSGITNHTPVTVNNNGSHSHSIKSKTSTAKTFNSSNTTSTGSIANNTSVNINTGYAEWSTTTNKIDLVHSHPSTITNVENTATSATSPHNNLQPYITCYIWKRTA